MKRAWAEIIDYMDPDCADGPSRILYRNRHRPFEEQLVEARKAAAKALRGLRKDGAQPVLFRREPNGGRAWEHDSGQVVLEVRR